jgi:hypothetical protein
MYGVRGLGLNCPGDPGCPGNLTPVDSQNVCDPASAAFDANICNNLYVPRPASLTQTLNTYQTPLLVGAGLLLLLSMGKR